MCGPGDPVEVLGRSRVELLTTLGEELFPAGGDEPSVAASGAFGYIGRRLCEDDALAAIYRTGLDVAAVTLGAQPTGTEVRAWLADQMRAGDDIPTGLSGAPTAEAIASAADDPSLFTVVFWQHLKEGMFGDPRHGGNTGGIMWRWLGYSGPQLHGYTESELLENALPIRPLKVADDWVGVRD